VFQERWRGQLWEKKGEGEKAGKEVREMQGPGHVRYLRLNEMEVTVGFGHDIDHNLEGSLWLHVKESPGVEKKRSLRRLLQSILVSFLLL
jgi:hypothetical protein